MLLQTYSDPPFVNFGRLPCQFSSQMDATSITEIQAHSLYNHRNWKLFPTSGFVYFKTCSGSCLPFQFSQQEKEPERERT